MTTPASLNAPSNSPGIQSVAESVLAEAQSIVNGGATRSVEAAKTPDVEPSMLAAMDDDDVEIEDTSDDGAPRKRSLSWNDAIKQVPPDIRNLMKQMQGDYTRKTQELAEQRKDFLREREALMRGAESLQDRELPDYDPFNEDTIKARIEAEVNRRLREVLEPMQQEYEVMQAEDNYKAFLSEHPEFKTDTALRSEVQHLLESNANLDLETAYWAAKGKQSKMQRAEEQQRKKATRAAAKEAAMTGTGAPRKVTPGGKVSRQQMRQMNNADLLALAQSMHRNR
jgi:hypothetical protein